MKSNLIRFIRGIVNHKNFFDRNSFWLLLLFLFYSTFLIAFFASDYLYSIVLFFSNYIPLIKKQSMIPGVEGRVGAAFITLSIFISAIIIFYISNRVSFYERIKYISSVNRESLTKKLIFLYAVFLPFIIGVLAIIFLAPIDLNSVSMGGRFINLISTNIVAMSLFGGLAQFSVLVLEIILFAAIKIPCELVVRFFKIGVKL